MKKILWFVFLLTTIVFPSCTIDDDSRLSAGGDSKLIINFSIQDPTSGMATRAAVAPEEGEENIKTLDLIFFEMNSDGTGVFKGWWYR